MLALALLAVLCAGVLAVETFKKAGRSSRMGEPQLLRLRDRHVADFAHEPARGQLWGIRPHLCQPWLLEGVTVASVKSNGRPASEIAGRGHVELGKSVLLELRLRNRSDQPIMVHRHLDPSDGLVQVAVTNPRGERRPFLPIDHTRTDLLSEQIERGQAIYALLDLTIGQCGCPFKEPGAYRIEVSHTNIDSRLAVAVMQLYLPAPASFDDKPVVNKLFNAGIGRALYVDGIRVMENVNGKLDWVRARLSAHRPISYHLTAVRYKP